VNEMELLARLRDELPASRVPPRAQEALRAAITSERGSHVTAPRGGLVLVERDQPPPPPRRQRGRAWRPALAAGLALAVAAGLAAGQALWPSRPYRLSVPGLTSAASAAAPAWSAVTPGQWVYRDVKVTGCVVSGTSRAWTTASASRVASLHKGKVRYESGSFINGIQILSVGSATFQSVGNGTEPIVGSASASASGVGLSTGCWQQPVTGLRTGPGGGMIVSSSANAVLFTALAMAPTISYADLRKLPRDPAALDRRLERLKLGNTGLGTGAARAFYLIQALLTTFVLPAALAAELYRALAALPGLRVDAHATDVAGRPGVGLVFPAGRGSQLSQELILNPRTYRIQGFELIRHARVLSGTAILRQSLVPRPGFLPLR
jgi:hypothetical protein